MSPRPWAPFARFVLWGSVNHGGTTTHDPRKGDNVGGAERIAPRRLRAAGRKLHTRYCRMAHLLRWVSPQLSVKYSSRHLPPRKSDRMYVDWLHMGRVGREAPAGLQTMRGIT